LFDKILYIVGEKQDDKHFVMDLARRNDSSVLLSGVMSRECRQVTTDGHTRTKVVNEETERQCWEDLYSLEEEMKKAGIKSSVMAQEGNVGNIQSLASSTHCSLVVLSAESLSDDDYRLPEDLLPNLPCPLIITNPQ
jgi:hypothetical protein